MSLADRWEDGCQQIVRRRIADLGKTETRRIVIEQGGAEEQRLAMQRFFATRSRMMECRYPAPAKPDINWLPEDEDEFGGDQEGCYLIFMAGDIHYHYHVIVKDVILKFYPAAEQWIAGPVCPKCPKIAEIPFPRLQWTMGQRIVPPEP